MSEFNKLSIDFTFFFIKMEKIDRLKIKTFDINKILLVDIYRIIYELDVRFV